MLVAEFSVLGRLLDSVICVFKMSTTGGGAWRNPLPNATQHGHAVPPPGAPGPSPLPLPLAPAAARGRRQPSAPCKKRTGASTRSTVQY
jgi:hypothetical protein